MTVPFFVQNCYALFRIMQKAGKDLLMGKDCLKVLREYMYSVSTPE